MAFRSLRLAFVPFLALLLTGCPDTPPTGSGPATIDKNYASPSCPAATYIYRATPTMDLDVYPHIAGASRGTIVFIHGGGLTGGDKRGGGGACATIGMGALLKQRERGWDFVSVDYRLVTSAAASKFPGSLIDVSEAVKWAQGLGGQWAGINGSRVVVAGHSAGGTLAALLGAYSGTAAVGTQFPSISGWMAISAPLDYGGDIDYTTPLGPFGSSNNLFENWVNGNVFGIPLVSAVPRENLSAGDPRGYLIHGANDPIVKVTHSYAMSNRAAQVGVDVQLDVVQQVAGNDGDRDHFAIGGADYNRLTGWLDSL